MNRRLVFLAISFSILAVGCGGSSVPTGALIAPSNLSATLVGTSANLTWTDSTTNESGFEVERFTTVGGWAFLFNTGANATSASVTNLEPGTTYAFRVRARNGSGTSAFSNEARLTVAGLDQPNRNPVSPYSPNFLSSLSTKGRWGATTLTYSVDKGSDSRSLADLQTMVATAAARWNTATNGLVTLNRVDSGANIQIRFAAASDVDFADGTVGITDHVDAATSSFPNRATFQSVTMKIKAEIPDGQFVPLIAHEFGHALGMGGHSSEPTDTMNAVVSASTLISARDANTLAKLYLTAD